MEDSSEDSQKFLHRVLGVPGVLKKFLHRVLGVVQKVLHRALGTLGVL